MHASLPQDLVREGLIKHEPCLLTRCETKMKTDGSYMLRKLLARGDQVYIQKGRLVIQPGSGKAVQDEWFAQNETELITSILLVTCRNAYYYQDYSAGNFGGGRYPGISMSFVELNTFGTVYCCYNAELTRTRNSKYGRKGQPLKIGQFHPPTSGKFVKTWRSLGMEMPRRISEFHEKMSSLKGILFSLSIGSGSKVDKDKISTLEIPFELIHLALHGEGSSGNHSAKHRQPIGNSSAKVFGKEVDVSEEMRGSERISTACDKHHETSHQGTSYQEDDISLSSDLVKDMSNDDWVDRYSAEKMH